VAYANKHGKSLPKVIDSEIGGSVKKALLALGKCSRWFAAGAQEEPASLTGLVSAWLALVYLVTPKGDYFAEKIKKSMEGAGTDDSALIRLISTQRGRYLKEIAAAYLTKYDKSLKQAISDECSGDYKRLLVAVIENQVENK